MLYRSPDPTVNTTTVIRGITLAYRPTMPIERAFIAAEIGKVTVEDPTITQAVAVAGASVVYTRHALRVDPADHKAIIAGDKPLISPSTQALERVIRAAGVDASWRVIERVL